jgi:hypothetical protein
MRLRFSARPTPEHPMTLILLAFAFAIGYTSGYLDGRRSTR